MKTREDYILLAVYSPFPTWFKVKNARSDVRILALADFAFAVEIPYRLRQGLDHIRPFSSQDIIDMVHRSDVRLPAFKGSRNAEKAHKVRVICMEELAALVSVRD